MPPRVYLETTIVSYLTAWKSTELVMAANQEATRCWWEEHRAKYDLFVSEVVVREASAGDPDAAARRLAVLSNLPELAIIEEAIDLANALIRRAPLPEKAQLDALHIALSAVHGMDYLLTWNCRHIANATLRHGIEATCQECGFVSPVICTPLELME